MRQTPIIAIIDDDEGVRTSLSSLIRSLGYGVRCHASALLFLHDPSPPPDLLITDVQMPGMTGDELQQVLLARGCPPPIIVMTAFPSDRIRAGAGGRRAGLSGQAHQRHRNRRGAGRRLSRPAGLIAPRNPGRSARSSMNCIPR
ncbi:response regulator transcription factor [Frigidibacter sp.]|uniref:response regulator transcription factor n=1 Tax=Frigidibacter sp. TaxID=2586418 RepID=UPI0027341FB7|nr:response regulator [Frigidibacter sp.]MDP3340209.1 response regulator [Frigidibacter sp.]